MLGLNSSLHLGHQALGPDTRLCLLRGQDTFGKLLTKVLEGLTEAPGYACLCTPAATGSPGQDVWLTPNPEAWPFLLDGAWKDENRRCH